jgi:hypothetical protein
LRKKKRFLSVVCTGVISIDIFRNKKTIIAEASWVERTIITKDEADLRTPRALKANHQDLEDRKEKQIIFEVLAVQNQSS